MAAISDLIVTGNTNLLGNLKFSIGSCSSLIKNGCEIATLCDLNSIDSKFEDYLPLSGGTMRGNIQMQNQRIVASGPAGLSFFGSGDIGYMCFTNKLGTELLKTGNNVESGGIGIEVLNGINFSSDTSDAVFNVADFCIYRRGTNFHISKPITCHGDVTAPAFYESSDIRKKNIIEDISLDKCYDLIDKCSTIIYTLKDDNINREQIGLIAQEVEEFFPEVVITDGNGFKSIDYTRISVICLKVLKDVITRLNKLEYG